MPFEEATLDGVENVICLQMVNYLTSNNFFPIILLMTHVREIGR